MKLPVLLMAISVSAGSLISCGPIVYTNVAPNVPLLKEKGETNLSGAVSLTTSYDLYDDLLGLSLNGATTVGKQMAIAGAFSYSGGKSEDDWMRNNVYWEGAAGWFKAGKGPLITEIYAGAGFGYINNTLTTGSDFAKIRYIKPFIQPSLGWRWRIVELAVTSRLAIVDLHSDTQYLDEFDSEIFNTYLNEIKTSFVFEPAFTFRVGKAVKFQYQLSYSTFQLSNDFFYSHNIFMSFGLSGRF